MPPLSIMIKPASSLCNMKCRYCFYHDVSDKREVKSFGIMENETAYVLIKKALEFADGESVAFAFQGGEPLMAGIEFFENFTEKVRKLNTKNSEIFYGIQTNGTLVNREWAEFFAKKKFLVGLSLDGNRQNNRFRINENGNNAFDRIINASEILREYGAQFNILTVLTGSCAENIDEIYGFFKQKGFKYLQFIPCLRPFGDSSESELYMTQRQYAKFLIHGFNAYVKDYVRGEYTSVRFFDNLVRLYLGEQPEQCGMCGHCMHQFVAEANGNIYPCDFYCTDEYLLGNISEESFDSFAHSKKAEDFLRESLAINEKCRNCRYFALCRAGGCKRLKNDTDYCEAYKAFFSSCLPLFRVFIGERNKNN